MYWRVLGKEAGVVTEKHGAKKAFFAALPDMKRAAAQLAEHGRTIAPDEATAIVKAVEVGVGRAAAGGGFRA